MDAQAGVEVDIARFIEFADHVSDVEQRPLHERRVARVRIEIPVARLGRRKKGRAAAQIEDQVAFGDPVPARLAEAQGLARRRHGGGEPLDVQLEGAEVPASPLDDTGEHGNIHDARRRQLGPALRAVGKQHGDVHAPGHLFRRVEGDLVVPDDQEDALRFHGDHRRRLHVEGGLGQKRRHLRGRLAALLGPAGALADVGEADVGGPFDLAEGLQEQRCLLGAGDHQRRALGGLALEFLELLAAKLAIDGKVLDPAGLGQDLGVERHGPFAVADQEFLAVAIHCRVASPRLGVSTPVILELLL